MSPASPNEHWLLMPTIQEMFRELGREAIVQLYFFHEHVVTVMGIPEGHFIHPTPEERWRAGHRYGRLPELLDELQSYEREGGLSHNAHLWDDSPRSGRAAMRYGVSTGRPQGDASIEEYDQWWLQLVIGAFDELLAEDDGAGLGSAALMVDTIASHQFNANEKLAGDLVGRHITRRVEASRQALLLGLQQRLRINKMFQQLGRRGTQRQSSIRSVPVEPSIRSKFSTVPGALEKWMGLLGSEGLVDSTGRFTMGSGVKGKGKVIAAWDAARSVFNLERFPSGAALKRALNAHIDGLHFSGRLDRVRLTSGFDTHRDGYKKVLRGN